MLWIFWGGRKYEFTWSYTNTQKVEKSIDNTPKLPPTLLKHTSNYIKSKQYSSRGEELCCRIMEEIYGVPFKKTRPDFLKNPETGRNLELDCYNEQLGIAIEFSGEQHYRWPNRFHKTLDQFIQQIRRDEFKREMCDENSVYLITVPYNVPENLMKDYIIHYLPENVTSVKKEK